MWTTCSRPYAVCESIERSNAVAALLEFKYVKASRDCPSHTGNCSRFGVMSKAKSQGVGSSRKYGTFISMCLRRSNRYEKCCKPNYSPIVVKDALRLTHARRASNCDRSMSTLGGLRICSGTV